MSDINFSEAFEHLTGHPPFPWQEELFRRFQEGVIERALDIPTGLGKTAVIAIWILAYSVNSKLPRRLVYVVDRRAVVDQASDVARKLQEKLEVLADLKNRLGLTGRSLPISTLRGQHVDNRLWQENPARPAIIVGTVDMIGSRLLFEGYGVSRKLRPYHAGLLGADTLLVLDEAHLVPPFEQLLEAISQNPQFGSRESLRHLIPPFTLMSLSATGRQASGQTFGLQEKDSEDEVVIKRITAKKNLSVHQLDDAELLVESIAKQAWELAEKGTANKRILVFCDSRDNAAKVNDEIGKLASGSKVDIDRQLFVGGRRVRERQEAADWLADRGFIAGTEVVLEKPAFVCATSAGEVGVDLDADHMVSDLVTWERMVQRLGRVNRRGDGNAQVKLFAALPKRDKKTRDALEKPEDERDQKEQDTVVRYQARVEAASILLKPLEKLRESDGSRDASPDALMELRHRAANDTELQTILDAATSPIPLRPELTRAVVDAWSMTSLKEHAGRPIIQPWLRGWTDDESQTRLVWRARLPLNSSGQLIGKKQCEGFFEAAPPHTSEILETETRRVADWLVSRAKTLLKPTDGEQDSGRTDNRVMAIALSPAGEQLAAYCLRDLDVTGDDKEKLVSEIAGATLIVDASLGGLKHGLLEAKEPHPPQTVDDGQEWMPPLDGTPVARFRVRVVNSDSPVDAEKTWRERFRCPRDQEGDETPSEWLIVEKWLHDSTTEDDRSTDQLQQLDEHQLQVKKQVEAISKELGLPEEYQRMLSVAARLHDEGKKSRRWQRAFNAPEDGNVYAKTPGPINVSLLEGYRHEFGSLATLQQDSEFLELSQELQELALHLVAAHHGFARPLISVSGCEDAPPSALDQRARDVALRFVRLQKQWGPWGLAWWESLLRAADQQASRNIAGPDNSSTQENANG